MIKDYDLIRFPLIRPAIRAGYFLGGTRGIGGIRLGSHEYIRPNWIREKT